MTIKANRKVRVAALFNGPVRDYSIYAGQRAIPSIVDGLKPSQRKVIFGTLKTASSIPEHGMKVAQLASYIANCTHYHHGEGSLSGAIIGLAQNFRGSNNINYLKPLGAFGSILSPEAGADRYIFTDLNPIFRKIFIKEDDLILNHLEEDGDKIEPDFYLPILPNVLINGANGMGTGFATNILCYNPEDLRKYILNAIQGKKQNVKLVPWYRGYKGTISRDEISNQITFKGVLEKVNSTTIKVSELPIGVYQDDYKELLIKLEDEGYIKSFENESVAEGFNFELTVPRATGYADDDELYKKLKLMTRQSENLTVWLPTGRLKRFDNAEALADYFIEFRLAKYEERRLAVVASLTHELDELNDRLRFIRFYLENAEKFSKKTKDELVALLEAEKFKFIDKLLEVRIYNLTKDQIDRLIKQIADVSLDLKYYETSTATSLYVKDLEALDLKKELA